MVTERTTLEIVEDDWNYAKCGRVTYKEWSNQVWVLKEEIKQILTTHVKDRTREQHFSMVKLLGAREYLLTMGEFKDFPIDVFNSPPDDEEPRLLDRLDSSILKKDSEEVGIPNNRSDTVSEEDNNITCTHKGCYHDWCVCHKEVKTK